MVLIGDGRADPNVTNWIGTQDAGRFYISALTVMELEIGVLCIERRDPGRGAAAKLLEERVLPKFADRTFPVDGAVVRRCAKLLVLDPCADREALIAATALAHGMNVVTRKRMHLAATEGTLIDPWPHKV